MSRCSCTPAYSFWGTFISAVSQVILKKAALKKYDSRIKEYLNFPVMFAYTLFVLTTFMCIIAYRVIPLSFGPVLEIDELYLCHDIRCPHLQGEGD